jgi:hypothetical protein
MSLFEEIGNDIGLFLPPMQPLACRCFESLPIAGPRLADSTLDVPIE